MEKILVTGGSGFIGNNLVKELLEKDKEVIVFDNGFRQSFENLEGFGKNLQIVKGDITVKEDWKLIPKDIDFVFHLAAINGTKYFYEIPHQVLKVNVLGIFNLFEWLQNSNANRFFFSSSSEVYGFPKIFPTPETESLVIPDPENPRFSYSSSKIIGETISINYAKSFGFEYSIGRFHNVYGPKMGFEHVIPEFIRKCLLNEDFSVQGDGTESRSFCFISDAIDGMMLMSEKDEGKNQIFNIGNSKETTINDLIIHLEKIYGKKINPKFTFFKNAGTKRRVPDLSKIEKIGYKPKVSLEKGLEITYDWYLKYYENKIQ